ncbi:uncharacterized protein LOC121873618 [Homarus americanus]|uniref:uncharacterized protein LOC121873618 n=1 Tax=Homarus americanus TaxID=6706 RepID=UPI001C4951C6|nr:uncharacterized protein LOC121873618 [Homarus americanus]
MTWLYTDQVLLLQDTTEGEAVGGGAGGSDSNQNGPSLPSGLSPAMAAAAAAAGGVGAHSLLQQTMCQLLRPSSPRPDLPLSPPPLGHGSESRHLYWGAHDLRADPDRQDTHSPLSIEPSKSGSDKGDSMSGTSGFPPKSPPPMGQFNMPAEIFQQHLDKKLRNFNIVRVIYISNIQRTTSTSPAAQPASRQTLQPSQRHLEIFCNIISKTTTSTAGSQHR